MTLPYMDHCEAALNPCSVETIPQPVALADGRSVWPMIVSCYELLDTSAAPTTQRRAGQMDLSLIEVPDLRGSASSLPLHLDSNPLRVESPSSGILDGKWSSIPNENDFNNAHKTWCFASAHSCGRIQIHSFRAAMACAENSDNYNTEDRGLESDPVYTFSLSAETDPPEGAPLCLSLAWDSPAAYKSRYTTDAKSSSRIVSTYSNGKMAIHDVVFPTEQDNDEVRYPQIIERDSWDAHTMFKSPSEVWSACFASPQQQERNMVLSGGDEGKLKVWDVRVTTRPMQAVEPFDGVGVTCLSPHPTLEHIVAAGSYDETICLFDVRYINSKRPLFHTPKLGGGVWRMKWHPDPSSPNRMLVGAMHFGCRVLNFRGGCFDGGNEENNNSYAAIRQSLSGSSFGSSFFGVDDADSVSEMAVRSTKKFCEHESMAYGADWLVCPHPTQNGYFEAAASCSFYDRSLYLWDTVY